MPFEDRYELEVDGVPVSWEDSEQLGDSALACLNICRETFAHGGTGDVTRSAKAVDLKCYMDVAMKSTMRVKAGMVEYTLAENFKGFKGTSPAFKHLERLQEEQGAQMEQLVMAGASREDTKLLVETHSNQLRIAAHAAELALKSFTHQQRHEFGLALAAISCRSKSIPMGLLAGREEHKPKDAKPEQSPTPQRGSLSAPIFGMGKIVKSVGTAGMSLVAGGLQKATSALPSTSLLSSAQVADDSPKSTQPQTPSEHDGSEVVAGNLMDGSMMLTLTVPATIHISGLRGMFVETTVQLVNQRVATQRYLRYSTKEATQIKERSENMLRIAKDQIGAWIVPISLDDVAKAAGERTSRGLQWWAEVGKDLGMVVPVHIVEAAGLCSELCFESLVDGLGEAVKESGEPVLVSGSILVTRHSNMPWCHMVVYVLYDPSEEAVFPSALSRALTLVHSASQIFIDTSKVSNFETSRQFISSALRTKSRLCLLNSSLTKQTWPLHTASCLREPPATEPPTTFVLSATQLINSGDLFAEFSPTVPQSPVSSSVAASR